MHYGIKQNPVYAWVSKMFLLLSPTYYFLFFLPLSLLQKHHLVKTYNYELCNSIHHSFTITCNHLILLLCWNILNSHLKPEIPQRPVLTVPCIIALNNAMSMRGFQKCILLLSPTDFFSPYPLSLLDKHPLVKTYSYEFNNSVHLPITSSLLEFNLSSHYC